MNRLQTIFSYELKRNFQRKGFLFMTFGVPLLLLVFLFGYDFYQQNLASEPDQEQQQALAEELNLDGIQKAGLVDMSGLLTDTPPALQSVIVRYDNIEAARDALQAGDLDLFYIVEEDFLETGDVTAHVPGLQLTLFNSAPVEALFYANLGTDLERNLEQRLRNPLNLSEINLERRTDSDTQQAQNEDTDFFIVYVFALGLLMPVFITNGYLIQSVLGEKENKLVEILISTVTPMQLLGGKILALGLLGLFQVGIWLAGGILAYFVAQQLPTFEGLAVLQALQLPLNLLPLMLVYFVLTYFLFAALYSTIGAITSSMSEGPQYATVFVLPAMVPLWFISLFLETPNATGPVIMSIFPLTAPLAMVMRVLLVPVPFWQIALSIVSLALLVVACIWIAGRAFRVQMLLSGQTPDLRDIPALLFSDSTSQQPETGRT